MNASSFSDSVNIRRGFLLSTAALVSGAVLGHRVWPRPPTDRLTEVKRQAATLRQRFPDVPTGSPEDVYAWQQLDPEKIVLIDVREPQEQAVSMLPTAIRAETVSELPRLNRDQILVPYCTIGYRSARFARELREAWPNVFNLEGGILAWCHAGLPLLSGSVSTRTVHVYASDWNLLPDGYTAVW